MTHQSLNHEVKEGLPRKHRSPSKASETFQKQAPNSHTVLVVECTISTLDPLLAVCFSAKMTSHSQHMQMDKNAIVKGQVCWSEAAAAMHVAEKATSC